MACPEGIGIHPVDHADILHVQHEIKASAMNRGVLMLAETLEIEWAAVDEEACAFNLHRPDTEIKGISIFPEPDSRLV